VSASRAGGTLSRMLPSNRTLNVAVVGATGMVGQEMLRVLAQRKFPAGKLKALASERSAGLDVRSNGWSIPVETLGEDSFDGVDLALFSAGSDVSLIYAPLAVEAGALVIDNSAAWRMKDNVPLVVPEVNPDDVRDNEGIIANPNCCAIPLTVVLEPLRKRAGLRRVLVSTYQSASGAGKALVEELEDQTRAIAAGRGPEAVVYPYQLAYNVVPGGWKPDQEGYNEEEVKIVEETRKILHEADLRIAATCVRVPVPVGHGRRRPPAAGLGPRRDRGGRSPREALPHAGWRGGKGRGLRGPHTQRPLGQPEPRALDRFRQSAQGGGAERGAGR
jgi:aspartate-semialdehyde dehydrogenase